MKHSYSWTKSVPDWHPESVRFNFDFREALVLMTLNREIVDWRAMSDSKKRKALEENPA